mmetsp:Transcript_12373/g.18490  ORF Transcript_12373/g.18490 Transcript_12373/m.18490 type:complete len:952 (+) Transcript_12373:119-2974(+)
MNQQNKKKEDETGYFTINQEEEETSEDLESEEDEITEEEEAKLEKRQRKKKKNPTAVTTPQSTQKNGEEKEKENEEIDEESEVEGDHSYNAYDEYYDTQETEGVETGKPALQPSYAETENNNIAKKKKQMKKKKLKRKGTTNLKVEAGVAPGIELEENDKELNKKKQEMLKKGLESGMKRRNSMSQIAGQSGIRRVSSSLQYMDEMKEMTPLSDVIENTLNEEKVQFCERKITPETLDVSVMLAEALRMRNKYTKVCYPWEKKARENASTSFEPEEENESGEDEEEDSDHRTKHPTQFGKKATSIEASEESFYMRKGVVTFAKPNREKFKPPVSYLHHYKDFKFLRRLLWNAATKSYCHHRLRMLELKFTLYRSLCQRAELSEQKDVPHRDFYNVRKVDNHIHCSSSMNQKHLLRFIKRKIKRQPNDKVYVKKGKELTLAEVCEDLKLNPYDLSVDSLEVHAGGQVVKHRFDKFNSKYNPFGVPQLREIFLKTDNHIKGRYFAEIVKETFTDMEESKYTHSEPRVSIYGRKIEEWNNLANWAIDNDVFSENIRWMIQIPRLFHLHKAKGLVENFEEMLENIFLPLFKVTKDPSSNPKLHQFLQHVVAFDHVDDESKSEGRFHSHLPPPDVWDKSNPPYAYYSYYLWANIHVLNQYRASKGLNTFGFRPHAGEAGDITHLISTYLCADGIAHGLELRRSPVLEYLYYLTQIGMSMSPLSNNHLFLKYNRSPFPEYFQRGHNVTLSTDDPLMFHFTKEPLVEEYSIAAQVWHFSPADLCEIARNSVLQSGWDHQTKKHWLGDNYTSWGVESNDMSKSNVPPLRVQYRYETLLSEHLFIEKCLLQKKENNDLPHTVQPILSREQLFYQISMMKTKFASLESNNPLNANPVIHEPSPFQVTRTEFPDPQKPSIVVTTKPSVSWKSPLILSSLVLSTLSVSHLAYSLYRYLKSTKN